ncbi:MAG: hypothetical protein KY469_09935 [Actinobacteria bacterium]|nr:hypothetical protein [Actinomycetota bacterium]
MELSATRDAAIREWARHLVPEAFAVPTRAHRVELARASDRTSDFDAWIAEQRRFARTVEYQFGRDAPPHGDHPLGVAIVEHGDERWRWDADCEEPRCLAAKVREDVATFRELWLFLTLTPGPRYAWLPPPDDEDGFEELQLVEPRWKMLWYAEARGQGTARIVTGIDHMDMWERVDTVPLPPRTPFERAAGDILRGHPDRRRHPIRRGRHQREA